VEEEAYFHVLLAVANLFPEHLGEKHQVIVVDPDHIPVLDIPDDSFGKETVHLTICAPGRLVEGDLAGVVVE
jgi:hypothetical protein